MSRHIVHAYGLGLSAGIGIVIWLMTHLVTGQEFTVHKAEEERRWQLNDTLRNEMLNRLLSDMTELKRSIQRVESILLDQRAEAKTFTPNRSVIAKEGIP